MITNVITCNGCRKNLVFATKADGSREFPDRIVHDGSAGGCKRYPSHPSVARAAEAERQRLLRVAEDVRQTVVRTARIYRLNCLIDLCERAIQGSENLVDGLDDPNSVFFEEDMTEETKKRISDEHELEVKSNLAKIEEYEKHLDLLFAEERESIAA